MYLSPMIDFIREHVRIHRHQGQVIERKPGFGYADVYYLTVEVDKSVLEAFRQTFTETVRQHAEHNDLRSGRLNYLTACGPGGFADPGQALTVFGLGEILGLWQVVTPLTMGIPEPQARAQAGGGLITITGYKG